jgi:hypothetical protein
MRQLVYCVRVMLVGCTRIGVEQSADIILTQLPCTVCKGPPEDEQGMLETCRGLDS